MVLIPYKALLTVLICPTCPDLPCFKKNHDTNTLGTHFNDIIHTVHVMTLSCLEIMTHGPSCTVFELFNDWRLPYDLSSCSAI